MAKLMRTFVVVLVSALSCGTVSWGGTVYYQLDNHPNGNAAPPYYGLRLDGLNGDASSIFTFSFSEDDGAEMHLAYTEGSSVKLIEIYGTAYGGPVDTTNETYTDPQLYSVSFKYSQNIHGDLSDGLYVEPEHRGSNPGNVGTIVGQVDGNVYNLIDEGGSDPDNASFFFDTGHRVSDADQWTGWGWLNHKPAGEAGGDYATDYNSHIAASDWLFTATELPQENPPPPPPSQVPEPHSLAIFAIGSLGLASVAGAGVDEGHAKLEPAQY